MHKTKDVVDIGDSSERASTGSKSAGLVPRSNERDDRRPVASVEEKHLHSVSLRGTESQMSDRKRKYSGKRETMKRPHIAAQLNPDGWTEDMHRALVKTIYNLGVKHASPSVILENMTFKHSAVTSERVKSHLQKYRNNKDKSREEFLDKYDEWMQQALTVGAAGGTNSSLVEPSAILEMMGADEPLGGHLAAYLTYSTIFEEVQEANKISQAQLSVRAIREGSQEYANSFTGARIPFPDLTDEERKSPLGASITHVINLFYSMTQYLMKERMSRDRQAENLVMVSEQVTADPQDNKGFENPGMANIDSNNSTLYRSDGSSSQRPQVDPASHRLQVDPTPRNPGTPENDPTGFGDRPPHDGHYNALEYLGYYEAD